MEVIEIVPVRTSMQPIYSITEPGIINPQYLSSIYYGYELLTMIISSFFRTSSLISTRGSDCIFASAAKALILQCGDDLFYSYRYRYQKNDSTNLLSTGAVAFALAVATTLEYTLNSPINENDGRVCQICDKSHALKDVTNNSNNFRWFAESIPIPGKSEEPPLDLMSVFSISNDQFIPRTPDKCWPSLYLPKDVYPPKKESLPRVAQTIIKAAADHQIILTKNGGTMKESNKSTGEFRYNIICGKIKKYYSNPSQPKLIQQSNGGYREGVRNDQVSGKEKGIRDEEKHEGKSGSRRTSTYKALYDKNKCGFKISLLLKEGQYWRIPHCYDHMKFHNHIRLNKKELRIPTSIISPTTKRVIATGSKYAGSGTAQGMTLDFSGITVDRNATRQIRKQTEDDGTRPNTSDSQQIFDYLKHQA